MCHAMLNTAHLYVPQIQSTLVMSKSAGPEKYFEIHVVRHKRTTEVHNLRDTTLA